jgi:hypothetical protein
MLDLQEIEREIGRAPWRELLKELRHDRRRFGAAIGDKSARTVLHWALGDLGLTARAGRRWLHHLRGNSAALRRVIDRALEARLLQRDAGRSDRHDRRAAAHGTRRAAGPAEPCAARSAGDRRDRLGDPPGAGISLASS